MGSGLEITFRGKPDDDTAAVIAQILGIVTSISERITSMATAFEDLSREVGEQNVVTQEVLTAVQSAIDLIISLRDQLAQGGLTAEEAAALAADLDTQQSALAAKLAALADTINPNTQVVVEPGVVQPE